MSDADDRDEELEEEEREEGEERNDDAREAAAAAAPEEELQDEKPFTGEVELALKAGAHDRIIVRFPAADEEGVPQWLHYLVNDDAYWFARCVEGKVRLQSNGAGAGAGGDEEEGEGAPAAAAAPATAGGGEDADGEDTNKTFVDPNKLFILTQTDGSDIFVCQRYVPPPPATEEEGQGGDEGGAAAAEADTAAGGADADGAGAEEEAEEAETDADAQNAQNVADGAVEAQAIEIIVDGLTLAALLSADCFAICLRQPKVHLRTLMHFVSERFTTTGGKVLDMLLSAKGALPAGAQTRQHVDFNWLIALHNGDPAAAAAGTGSLNAKKAPSTQATGRIDEAATAALERLIAADIVPSAPIAATTLRTTAAVNAYVWLLLHMPKSILLQWSKPTADEEDGGGAVEVPEEAAEEAALSTNAPVARFVTLVLLDLRRRAARAAKGKPPLREPIEQSHARALQISPSAVAAIAALTRSPPRSSRRARTSLSTSSCACPTSRSSPWAAMTSPSRPSRRGFSSV
jgi:hypothetical protein